MTYAIKEIYATLQGEGAQTGRPAVFLRFSGCNLWSGREADRHKAICQFCDTDFWGTNGVHGGKYPADALADRVREIWDKAGFGANQPMVVCTGGEPLLQLDRPLLVELHRAGLEIAIETNGTLPVPPGVDWVCMSPKANTRIVVRSGDEIKVIFPQDGIDPQRFSGWDFTHFLLQPMDGPLLTANTLATIDYCNRYPQWQPSIQTHKLLAIP
ncbi:MAG: 7-carboxy-7-deazaguanine synthase [Saprospiraceae bacterium]|nr:7-carboxy-7-deazaguanine synthase [Saprospiraceae bacterium]